MIYIRNSKKLLTKEQVERLRRCYKHLIDTKLSKSNIAKLGRIDVNIKPLPNLEGTCCHRVNHFNECLDFSIEINGSNPSWLRTACHEFVHLKQALNGKGEYNPDIGAFEWEGKMFRYDTKYWEQLSHKDYKSLPWEKQAYSLEGKWLNSFLESEDA